MLQRQKKIVSLLVRAKQNDQDALTQLGCIYFKGQQVKKDDLKAVGYYEQAAALNYPPAQFNLAIMYENGFGVEINYDLAKVFLEKSARQNYLPAQFNLGCLYQKYFNQLELAAYWYDLAASKNHPQAQHNLAMLLTNGQGIPKDFVAAVNWFKKAAAGGEVKSLYALACLCEQGIAMIKDDQLVRDLLLQAAQQNYAPAIAKLGLNSQIAILK
jgi:TPR repeat protein